MILALELVSTVTIVQVRIMLGLVLHASALMGQQPLCTLIVLFLHRRHTGTKRHPTSPQTATITRIICDSMHYL